MFEQMLARELARECVSLFTPVSLQCGRLTSHRDQVVSLQDSIDTLRPTVAVATVIPLTPDGDGHLAQVTSRFRIRIASVSRGDPVAADGNAHNMLPLRKDGLMSSRHYRKAAAVALVAGLALSVAACSSSSKKTDSSSSEPGKVTITVDCMPVDAQATLKKDWNDDVAAFEKLHPNITIESKSVGSQCDNPPDFTARLRGGTMTDVFYAYMTDQEQVLDSGQAMDITKYINDKTVPTWDVDRRQRQGAVPGRRQDLRHPDQELHHGSGLQQEPVHAGRPRPDEPADDLAGRCQGRQEDRGAGRRHRSATPTTAPATPVAGTSPPSSTRAAARWSPTTARPPTFNNAQGSACCRTSRTCGSPTTASARSSCCSGRTC